MQVIYQKKEPLKIPHAQIEAKNITVSGDLAFEIGLGEGYAFGGHLEPVIQVFLRKVAFPRRYLLHEGPRPLFFLEDAFFNAQDVLEALADETRPSFLPPVIRIMIERNVGEVRFHLMIGAWEARRRVSVYEVHDLFDLY